MAKTCCYYYSAAAVAFLFLHCASAQIAFVVGDALRWAVPHDPEFFTTWASPKTFRLNDKLLFDFDKDEHDVVKVPKEVYDSCSFPNQVLNTIKTGAYNHILNETGANYFVCTNVRHCKMGLKLAVNVVSGSFTTPSNAPSPSSSSDPVDPQPPPPPGSAAPPALAAGSFLIITLSFVLGKLVL